MIGNNECSSKASPDYDVSIANSCLARGRVMGACQEGCSPIFSGRFRGPSDHPSAPASISKAPQWISTAPRPYVTTERSAGCALVKRDPKRLRHQKVGRSAEHKHAFWVPSTRHARTTGKRSGYECLIHSQAKSESQAFLPPLCCESVARHR
jgi:hypothetical protein